MVTAARQSTAAALLTTAITRGRLAELIGEDLFDSQERDNLFIVGAFSLLGVILKAPLQSIVEQVPLSETILDALFRHEGPYGPVLSIVEASESFEQPEVRAKALEIAGLLGLTTQHLNRAQLEAVAWAEGLSR
jgi:EAL and modified HD-GYP domain-containing signal transduction protein